MGNNFQFFNIELIELINSIYFNKFVLLLQFHCNVVCPVKDLLLKIRSRNSKFLTYLIALVLWIEILNPRFFDNFLDLYPIKCSLYNFDTGINVWT